MQKGQTQNSQQMKDLLLWIMQFFMFSFYTIDFSFEPTPTNGYNMRQLTGYFHRLMIKTIRQVEEDGIRIYNL